MNLSIYNNNIYNEDFLIDENNGTTTVAVVRYYKYLLQMRQQRPEIMKESHALLAKCHQTCVVIICYAALL